MTIIQQGNFKRLAYLSWNKSCYFFIQKNIFYFRTEQNGQGKWAGVGVGGGGGGGGGGGVGGGGGGGNTFYKFTIVLFYDH